MSNNVALSLPSDGNITLEIPRELLETPEDGQPAAKPLKEDSDYLIYNDGRLFSIKAKRFLKGKIDNIGYQVYRLAIFNELTGKMGKMLYAHRLVAEYFIPNDDPLNKIYVHHKDENKLNNNVSNLVMEYKETGLCPSEALCEFSDKYEKITIKEKYVPKTPGLSLILKDPYYIKSERVVLKDE